MLRRVVFVRINVLEERIASFFRVTRISKLGTTLNNGVFWDVTPRAFFKNQRFGGTYRLLLQCDKNQ
jgi:hypothetical protein